MSKIHVSELDLRQWVTAKQAAVLLGVRITEAGKARLARIRGEC